MIKISIKGGNDFHQPLINSNTNSYMIPAPIFEVSFFFKDTNKLKSIGNSCDQNSSFKDSNFI